MSTSGTSRLHSRSSLVSILRCAARNESGATLVETAIAILVFFCLLLGVIQGGMAAYSYHYLSNAAHEATRYAIVRGASWGSSCDGSGAAGSGYDSSMCTASTEDIANFVARRGFPGIHIVPSDVCVEYFSSVPSSASTSCTTSTGSTLSNSTGDIVQVTITYPFSFSLPGLRTYTYTMSSTSQMVIAQ